MMPHGMLAFERDQRGANRLGAWTDEEVLFESGAALPEPVPVGMLVCDGTEGPWWRAWQELGREEWTDKVQRTMRSIGGRYATRADEIDECARDGHVLAHRTDPSKSTWAPWHCKDRWHSGCYHARTKKTLRRLGHHTDKARAGSVRALTLGEAPGWIQEGPKAAMRALMKRCWRMRNRAPFAAIWKRKVKGAFFAFEVTWTDTGWHPHAHILAEGEYWLSMCAKAYEASGLAIPLGSESCSTSDPCLSCFWSWVTEGRSHVIDIRREFNLAHQIKYALKPEKDLPEDRLREAILDLNGVHQYAWTGAWYATKLPDEDTDYITTTLQMLRWAATAGEGWEGYDPEWAQAVLAAVWARFRLHASQAALRAARPFRQWDGA